ncbi:MAG: DeoR/GlpR family DNA-binding transcription regulator [Spirochaetales bacterium]|nr:DeoR/GlpR family DNA-binding transcription regulator [Spirochaetales bacterium]
MPNEIIPIERQQRILEIADEHGVVRVNELSKLFDVSVMTIRRDLVTLEEQGLLRRSHGGAISRKRFQREPDFDQKGKRNRAEKETIGRLAATLVEPGETILVNSGSTTLELLRHLPDIELRVVTSNAGAVSALMASRIECIIVGGVYRQRSNSFVGGFAVQTLGNVYGSKSFIGVDGFDLEAGLTTPHHQEAEIARQMIRRTRGETIVLADSSKIGGVSPFVTTSLDAIDVVITDTGIADEYRSALEERGITVLLADVDTAADHGTAEPPAEIIDSAGAAR